MTPQPQSKELSFEIAIVDGINIFVREVLAKRGCINSDKAEDIGSEEVLREKYRIARHLASRWAKMPTSD